MKMGYFIVLVFALMTYNQLWGQRFYKNGEKLVLFSDSTRTIPLSSDQYEACFCEPVFGAKKSDPLYYEPSLYHGSFVLVKVGGLWGAIDKTGKYVVKPSFSVPTLVYKNLRGEITETKKEFLSESIQVNSKLTIIDSTLKFKDSLRIQDEYKGYMLVTKDNEHYGIMSAQLQTVLALEYRSIIYTKDRFFFNPNGLITLKKDFGPDDTRCGIFNYKGQTIVALKYDFIGDYIANEEVIFAQINDGRGYINAKGEIVLPLIYKKLPYEFGDTNLVATEKQIWWMGRDFKPINGQKYESLEWKKDRYFFKQNGKWGTMDSSLNIIVPNLYSSIMDGPRMKGNTDFKCYIVIKNGKYGLISLTNEVIIPIEYNCLCGLSYFAPDTYYIEFQKGGVSYKFNEKGELVEKGKPSGKPCMCESYD